MSELFKRLIKQQIEYSLAYGMAIYLNNIRYNKKVVVRDLLKKCDREMCFFAAKKNYYYQQRKNILIQLDSIAF